MNEEYEKIEIKTFNEIIKVAEILKKQNKLILDIIHLSDQYERRRVMDFLTGIAFAKNLKIRNINKQGVFLIYDII